MCMLEFSVLEFYSLTPINYSLSQLHLEPKHPNFLPSYTSSLVLSPQAVLEDYRGLGTRVLALHDP